MKYKVSEIVAITGAQLLNKSLFDYDITQLYFDTRRGNKGNDGLFLALGGNNADGHTYISNAYHLLGTRSFLISKSIAIDSFPDANFLLCEDVVTSLQAFAKAHRSKFTIPVVGITGSNGKTIIKEWIHQICSPFVHIVRSPKSYNSQIGVPLSILKMEAQHEVAVFEAGISGMNEMQNLSEIIQPTIGIISNIGDAHSAGFNSVEDKLAEKLKLFTYADKVIFCKDSLVIEQALKSLKIEKIAWTTNDRNAKYFVNYDGKDILINKNRYHIPFIDAISRENAVFSLIAAMELGIRPHSNLELKALKMRLEMKEGINNCLLINDTYNSDFEALSSAITVLKQQQKRNRNTLILSQIEESNLEQGEYLHKLSELIENQNIERVISVGEKLNQFKLAAEHIHFEDTENLVASLPDIEFRNENILIKGARKYNLEQIFEMLSTKVHQTILEIDLEAMRHNLQVYRSYLKADTKLMVVLKASGYGSGSKELSRFLAFQRVDYIAVAYIDEGIELRKSGIKLPILVMNPEESGFPAMIRFELEPEIYSLSQLENYMSYLGDDAYKIHLKIETGMHRLGISKEEIAGIAKVILENSQVQVASVFSHLVGSDDPSLDDFSRTQIQQFDEAYENLCQFLNERPARHLLNSNGISRFPVYQFEMVRLGIGLHGLTDDPVLRPQLRKVQKLTTKIAQIKTLEKGESVGYNRKYVSKSKHNIGTINIGYADGLPRNAGNGNYSVLLNRASAPILGNVCMDMCMIDLSGINANVGDEVVIFGPEWPIEKLAEACDTIPYEILTRLSSRIHRIFSRE